MTENRRIALNVIATYARSAFAIACSIFTSRWILNALGEVDYGLMGVVGSLLAFMAFFNGVFTMSSCRFFAVAVGGERMTADRAAAVEECRRWFSVSIAVHWSMAAVFAAVGWPLGEWLVENVLKIPPDRLEAAVTVFRYSAAACFFGMLSIPFSAMYTAKQEIGEITFWSLAVTVFLVCVARYMFVHPGDWMATFAKLTAVSSIVQSAWYGIRGAVRFPECRVKFAYATDLRRFRELFAFALWAFVGPLGILLRTQGVMVLVNRAFNPAANAALALARTLSEKSNTLSESVKSAMAPAIVQARGSGDLERMRGLASRMSRFALLVAVAFSAPLVLEMDGVLGLWLGNPPEHLKWLAVCTLGEYVAGVATCGYDTAVYANGRIALYQCVAGFFALATLPAAYMAVRLGGGVVAVGATSAAMLAAYSLVRIVVASRLTGLSVSEWLDKTVVPVAVAALAATAAGCAFRFSMSPSLFRMALTACAVEAVYLPVMWRLVLSEEERGIVRRRVCMITGARP